MDENDLSNNQELNVSDSSNNFQENTQNTQQTYTQQIPAQNPYEQQSQNGYQAQNPYEQPNQNAFQAQNPYEQPTQFGQQPFVPNNGPTTGMPDPNAFKKKKKGKKVLIVLLIVIAIIGLGVGATLVFAGEYVSNFVSKLTKSDADYFAWVEQKNSSVNDITKETGESIEFISSLLSKGVDTSSTIRVELGEKLTDKLDIGEIKVVELNQELKQKDAAIDMLISLLYGDKELLTANTVVDFEKALAYLKLPQLSDAFLDLSEGFGLKEEISKIITELFSSTKELANSEIFKKFTSQEFLERIINDYYFEAIKLLSNVEKTNSERVVIGDNETTCTKISINITNDDLKSIISYIIETLSKDDEILDLFISLLPKEAGVSKQEIVDSLKKVPESFAKNSTEELGGIDLYVDSKGTIIGRNIKVKVGNTEGNFAYCDYSKGDETIINANLKAAGLNILKISVNGTKVDDVANGKITIEVPMASLFLGTASSKLALNIEYSDFVANNDVVKGNLTFKIDAPEDMEIIPGLTLGNYQIESIFSFTKEESSFVLIAYDNGKLLAKLDLAGTLKPMNEEIKLPAASDKVINPEIDYEDFFEEFTVDKLNNFLENIVNTIDNPKVEELLKGLFTTVDNLGIDTIELPSDIDIDDSEIDYPIDPIDPIEPDEPDEPKDVEEEIDTSKTYNYSHDYLADYITLGPVEGYTIEIESLVSDEDLQDRIDNELYYDSMPTSEISDGLQIDDAVQLDYEVYIQNILREEFSEYGDYFTIGSDWNTDLEKAIESLLIGKNTGDTFTATIEAPESLGLAEGIEIDVTITIIDVTRFILPEYNLEYAETKGFDSLEAYEAALREELEADRTRYYKQYYIEDITNLIYENSEVEEIPEQIMQKEVDSFIATYKKIGQAEDMTYEELIDSYGLTTEAFEDAMRLEVEYILPNRMVMAAIARELGFAIKGEEYKEYIENEYISQYYWPTYSSLLEYYLEEQLVDNFLEEKIGDYLLSVTNLEKTE